MRRRMSGEVRSRQAMLTCTMENHISLVVIVKMQGQNTADAGIILVAMRYCIALVDGKCGPHTATARG